MVPPMSWHKFWLIGKPILAAKSKMYTMNKELTLGIEIEVIIQVTILIFFKQIEDIGEPFFFNAYARVFHSENHARRRSLSLNEDI